MEKIIIPVFGNRISPRLEYAKSFQLITVENNAIVEKESVKILANNMLERINMIINIQPDVVICNGISDLCKEELLKNNIKIFPWINGNVETVLKKYLNKKLKREYGKL